MGPAPTHDVAAREAPARARRQRRDARGRPGARQARHRHGPLGRLASWPRPTRDVVGLATHLATADTDLDFARAQIERFREATAPYAHLTRHAANSAAALRLPESRFDAARCGIALYGLSPFGTDPADDGLEPVLSWTSELGLCTAAAPRRVDRLRPPLRRRARHVDRDRPGRLRGRLPPRPDRHRGARRGRAAAAWSGRSRWTRSPSSSTASCRAGRR